MCYLGRGETEQEVTTLCLFLKEKLNNEPKSIVIDYKPAWTLGIKKVFPKTLIIRDAFHTVQLINRAIFKELRSISRKIHKRPIKETKRLYQEIKKDEWTGNSIKFIPNHIVVEEFKNFYLWLVTLYNINEVQLFIQELNAVMHALNEKNTVHSLSLLNELSKRLPKNGLTEKNVKYYKKKLKGALSLVMREFRRPLEQDKKEFNGMKYLLVKREENLTARESNSLREFLRKFPEYKKYRELSLRISGIYHLPPEELTDSIITDITLWANAETPLKSAVNTLKKNVREIFNFKHAFSKKVSDELYKKVRTSPEHSMRKIKEVVRNVLQKHLNSSWNTN
ncbi:MAG: transposase [Candidatus Helarchaeota archaeon]